MAALRPSDDLPAQVAAYTCEAVSAVARADLSAPTPCGLWALQALPLQALLLHLNSPIGSLIAMLRDGRAGPPAGLTAGRRSRASPPPGSRPGDRRVAPLGRTPDGTSRR